MLSVARSSTVAFAVLLLASCSPATPARERQDAAEASAAADVLSVVDDAGQTLWLDYPPTRIISLIPAVTEMLRALGAGDRLVARTDFDTDPELAHLPSVGQGLTPNLEWLLARRADLVIAWADGPARDVVSRLAELGTPVYSTRLDSLGAIDRTLHNLGAVVGRGARANSVVAQLHAELDAVRAAVRGRPRPTLVYALGREPPWTAGAGTFVHEIIMIAGAENVFGDLAGWPQVSPEELIRRNPARVLVPVTAADPDPVRAIRSAPVWRELPAVREGRVLTVDGDLFNRPGVRVGESALRLASQLHPEAFSSRELRATGD